MRLQSEGLIIREQAVGESDRLVTVITRDCGVVKAFAHHAKNMKSSLNAATQLLCYSRLKLYQGRDGTYTVGEAMPIEVFFELRTDIARLSLAQYFCELVGVLAVENDDSSALLRLILNALHFLCRDLRPQPLIKAVLELRSLSISGFMPDLTGCMECGCYEASDGEMFFFPAEGALLCGDCLRAAGRGEFGALAVPPGVLHALRHIVYSDFEKIFSFSLPPQGLAQLGKVSESYALHTLDRSFRTLDFYKSLT